MKFKLFSILSLSHIKISRLRNSSWILTIYQTVRAWKPRHGNSLILITCYPITQNISITPQHKQVSHPSHLTSVSVINLPMYIIWLSPKPKYSTKYQTLRNFLRMTQPQNKNLRKLIRKSNRTKKPLLNWKIERSKNRLRSGLSLKIRIRKWLRARISNKKMRHNILKK